MKTQRQILMFKTEREDCPEGSAIMSKEKLNTKRVLKRAARRAASRSTMDAAVIDVFAAAMNGTFDPNDINGGLISFFSDDALEFGKRHVATIRSAAIAERQQLVSREDRRRLSELVLHSIVALGNLSLAVKVNPTEAGASGGRQKGTGGGARMPKSKKALGEALDLTHRNLTDAETIALNPWAVRQVISDSRSTRADATLRQVLNLINEKKKSTQPPTVRDFLRDATKAQRNSNSYQSSIYAHWNEVPRSEQQELLETMRECSDHYTRLLKLQSRKVA